MIEINQIIVIIGFFSIDLIGIFSLMKPIHISRFKFKLKTIKSILTNKYSLVSLFTELGGLGVLISSFFLPWYFQHLIGWPIGHIFHYYYLFRDLVFIHYMLNFLLYYAYIIALLILFVRFSSNIKINGHFSLVIIKLLFFVPGIVIILNTKIGCPYFLIPEEFCVDYGYSFGFFFYIIGFIILIANGLQVILYTRIKRNTN